jgi:hypothetical protein
VLGHKHGHNFTDGCLNVADQVVSYTWTVDLIKPVIATTAQGGGETKDVINNRCTNLYINRGM